MANSVLELRHIDGRTRKLPATNTSVEFILNQVALAESSQYVPELDKFVSLSEAQDHEDVMQALWTESAAEQEKLVAAIELLRQKTRASDTPKTETELRNYNWTQVIREVNDASNKYKNDRGKATNIFRNMCDNAGIFENWLRLLPDGDYGATISGAFIMAVRAARNVSETRQLIYETLASIPDTLAHAGTYIEIYKAHSSKTLVQQTAALLKRILITLRLIIQFFLQSSFKRGFCAVVKGSDFEKELKDSIQEMKNQVLRLREEANLCLQKRITEMDRKSDLREFREQSRQQLAKEELLLAIDSSTEITAQKVCTFLLRQLQASPSFDVRTGSPAGKAISGPEPTVHVHKAAGPTPEDLLKVLDYDHDSPRKNIKNALSIGYTQSEPTHARSTWILHSAELGEFLAGKDESRLLLINGNCEATEFLSPLSAVCAKISDLISVSSRIILVTYFCGYHTDELRDYRANAQGMLVSLVGQLFTQVKDWKHGDWGLDLSSISDDDWAAIQEESLDALFDIFRAVVMQLPKNTVIFCLIDSLSAYEDSKRKEDTIALMQKLARLVRKSTCVTFKLLVTCPGQSIYASLWTDFNSKRAQIMHVPEIL
ncbi:hypothetical protein CONLIGDRAFT_700977 [Coniochaeta ligniaria NRRL 30616]|uniref:Uncharacterized protein n=1 Tax=Coniochaeta ligniaria NRRL 30616 TaxID=1408157 RepID=A0A1J7IVM4_9PEZI|nr:hypothetical protein CONLIGDRAFT_700977 [Coniochaeta ligniaria NRRL 30616]